MGNDNNSDNIIKEADTDHAIHISESASDQLYNTIVRIEKGNSSGTGFFMKVNILGKNKIFFFTCAHVISEDDINSKIAMDIYYGKKSEEKKISIKLDKKERFTLSFKGDKDVTVIEVLEKDKIPENKFLLPDLNYRHGYDIYKKGKFLLAGYPKDEIYQKERHISSGQIKSIYNIYEFSHSLDTRAGSSGSPICLYPNIQVIGIHKGGSTEKTINYGTFIGKIIDELENKYKEIKQEKKYVLQNSKSQYLKPLYNSLNTKMNQLLINNSPIKNNKNQNMINKRHSKLRFVNLLNILLIDQNILIEEYNKFCNDLLSFLKYNSFEYTHFKLNKFLQVNEAINLIKNIRFEATIIIINGKLYYDFIIKFKENINNIFIIPKIIIYTRNINNFKEDLKFKNFYQILNNKYYTFGGIKTSFEDIKKFILNNISHQTLNSNLLNENIPKRKDINYFEGDLIFDYIDSKEKLILPLFHSSIIDLNRDENNEDFIKSIYMNENCNELKMLLNSIIQIPEIPIELLSKYYVRIYTSQCFYKKINEDLRNTNKDSYLPYLITLFKAIKLKSLPLNSNNILYKFILLSKMEIHMISHCLLSKKPGLPGCIVFSKTFISFYKDLNFLNGKINSIENNILDKYELVLFKLEKDDSLERYYSSIPIDMEKFSYFPEEKEVLFFPFTSFGIESINVINYNNKKIYLIKLSYLDKFKKLFKINK